MLLDPNAEPTNLPMSLLKTITNNFSDQKKIGRGGFADVYQVRLMSDFSTFLITFDLKSLCSYVHACSQCNFVTVGSTSE